MQSAVHENLTGSSAIMMCAAAGKPSQLGEESKRGVCEQRAGKRALGAPTTRREL
jgi:hypothetical protein